MGLAFIALPSFVALAGDVGESLSFQGRSPAWKYPVAAAGSGVVLFTSAPSDPPGAPFDTILFHGILPDPNVEFQFSVQAGMGLWSAWQTAAIHHYPGGRFWGKLELSAPSAGRVRMRAVSRGVAQHTLTLFDVEVFDRSIGESPAPGPGPGAREGVEGGQGGGGGDGPPVIERDGWGARPPKEAYTPHQPEKISFHHTAGRQTFDLRESLEEVRFIQEFHMEGRGWNDIGYHFLIDGSGRVFRGRPEEAVGAHVREANTGNLGITYLGNYHPPIDHPAKPEQDETFVALGRRLAAKHLFAGSTLKGHRDYGPTSCPGDGLYGKLEDFRRRMDEKAPPPLPHSLGESPAYFQLLK